MAPTAKPVRAHIQRRLACVNWAHIDKPSSGSEYLSLEVCGFRQDRDQHVRGCDYREVLSGALQGLFGGSEWLRPDKNPADGSHEIKTR